MKAIKPWLLRILEFSLIECVMVPHFRFTCWYFWTTTHNILSGRKFYMKSYMTSMDKVDWDCTKYYGTALEGRLDELCSKNSGLYSLLGGCTPSYILQTRAFGTYLLGGLFILQKGL